MTSTATGRVFAAWLTHRHYSPATVANYVAYVERAEQALGPLEHTGFEDLFDWWAGLPDTASSRNGARKALIGWWHSTGDGDGGPAVRLPQLAPPPGSPNPVDRSVFVALHTAAVGLGGEHQALAVLLGSTGCRISEARLARWEQFRLDGDRPVWRVVGKGSARRGPKLRDLALHQSAVTVLRRWRRACPSRVWVFPSPRLSGRPLTDGTIRRRVYEIADAAGVDDRVNPHRWRHTVATAALDGTGNLAAVQDLLGHADPATTRRYASVSFDRMFEVVDAVVAYATPGLYAVS
jgi:integrase